MSKRRNPLLIVGLLMMTAPAGVSQVNTAKPGEPVERHLSSDQTFREWSHESNSTATDRIDIVGTPGKKFGWVTKGKY